MSVTAPKRRHLARPAPSLRLAAFALAMALATGMAGHPAHAQPASAISRADMADWERLHEAMRGYYASGQTSSALQMAQRMADLSARAAPPLHPIQLISAWKLGLLYLEQGERRRAEPLLRRALALTDRMSSPDLAAQASIVAALANLCAREGRMDEAEPLYARAAALYAMPDEESRAGQLRMQYEQAVMYSVLKDNTRAQSMLEKSLATYETMPPSQQSARMPQVLRLLGVLRREKKDLDGALKYFQRALEIAQRQSPPFQPLIGLVLTEIAVTEVAAGRLDAAEEPARRALEILNAPTSSDNDSLSRMLHTIAQIRLATGNIEEAHKSAKRALELKQLLFRSSAAELAETVDLMADIEDRRGNTAEAAALRARSQTAKEARSERERDPIATQATYVAAPPVEYPAVARNGGYEGKVLLRAMVGADGIPAFVTVAESSSYAVLDDAATAAVLRMQFTPARTRSGKTAPSSVMVPIDYRLTGNATASAAPRTGADPGNNYAARVAAAVRPNLIFSTDGVQGNPAAEFGLELRPDGWIIRVVLEKSSGYPEWDEAARRGIIKTERLPFDSNGRVPPRMVMSLRPFR